MFGQQCPDYIQLSKKIQQLEAENARLREENKELAGGFKRDLAHKLQQQTAKNKRLKEELAAARKDAERYRWLRDTQEGKTVRIMYRREWNKAIDAALKEKTE